MEDAKIVEELTKLAFADVRELFDENGRRIEIHELDDEVAAALG